jgi:murein DD-endopeptidase MepM/ murein hydrolase activator NlpD
MLGARLLLVPLAAALAGLAPLGETLPVGEAAALGWSWPVVGPVIRGFDPPSTPYGAGHRGIDIATAFGTPVRAPAPGVVTFAGHVAGALFVSVDHGGGLVSTYSWLSSVLVRKGDLVAAGAVLALSGAGHPGVSPPHLHFGVKRDGTYVDPLSLLAPASLVGLIRLVVVPPGSV